LLTTSSIPLALLTCLTVLLPFFSFWVLIGWGKKLPHQGDRFALFFASLNFLCALLLLSYVWGQPAWHVHISWFTLPGGKPWLMSILLDQLSALMLALVCFVSLLVQVYSVGYMHGDKQYSRYFAYLSLFTFAMLGLVLSGNLLLMYAFWELVGLSSYLLIGFWMDRPKAAAASKKAFLFNRVGDAGFLIGIILLSTGCATTDLIYLAARSLPEAGWAPRGGLCLFSGCVGKSAQFPLQAWLPDAMEGPTPVSALIHAATMVAAGIFLLARVHRLLTPDALTVIAAIGATTAFMGAYAALFQNDIKKVLAFSTISQLGLMVMGMGVGASSAALFHLFTHAFFKAGLFLSAGAVIYAVHHAASVVKDSHLYVEYDTHDMRRMGGLRHQMPFTFVCYLIVAAALAGIPLFSGFLSKDAILAEAVSWASSKGVFFSLDGIFWLIPLAAFAATLLTAFYISRQVLMVFFGSWRGAKGIHPHIADAPLVMRVPLVLLALLSLGIVFSLNPLNVHGSWLLSLFSQEALLTSSMRNVVTPTHPNSHEGYLIPLLSVLISGIGIGIAYMQFHRKEAFRKLDFRNQMPHIRERFARDSKAMQPVLFFYYLSVNNWYLDKLYARIVAAPLLAVATSVKTFDQRIIDRGGDLFGIIHVVIAHMLSWCDRTLVDGGVNLLAYLAGQLGRLTRSFQNGKIQAYFLFALLGLVFVAIWIAW
jgi:NADH-quinone oxidoreductase subunit L